METFMILTSTYPNTQLQLILNISLNSSILGTRTKTSDNSQRNEPEKHMANSVQNLNITRQVKFDLQTGNHNNTFNMHKGRDYIQSGFGGDNFTTSSGILFERNSSSMVETYFTNSIFVNGTADSILNPTDYHQLSNESSGTSIAGSWGHCKEWTPSQHDLYQTANILLATAFLIPGRFKQSVLLVRALLTLGYILLSAWAGSDVCAADLLLWNFFQFLLNFIHTILLTWRFLPPTLTFELTDLYLKVFRPLRVSKKHFKELVQDAHVVNLENGDIYAVENISPADERLSILLKGKLKVTCDDTHLHFITTHEFVDSPEWESNHETSDDVFQVTITAEEDSVYLCWSRMRLERILRHRPMLKVVLDSIIGKDITQKLYSLNEHLCGLDDKRERTKRNELWDKAHPRSLSLDAVNMGTTGLVRSSHYKNEQRKNSFTSSYICDSIGLQTQTWVPLIANHFPVISPFTPEIDGTETPPVDITSTTTLLKVPEAPHTPQRGRSVKKNREVTFQDVN